jgi:hypothetical protein
MGLRGKWRFRIAEYALGILAVIALMWTPETRKGLLIFIALVCVLFLGVGIAVRHQRGRPELDDMVIYNLGRRRVSQHCGRRHGHLCV